MAHALIVVAAGGNPGSLPNRVQCDPSIAVDLLAALRPIAAQLTTAITEPVNGGVVVWLTDGERDAVMGAVGRADGNGGAA